jgi:hypothetical protein
MNAKSKNTAREKEREGETEGEAQRDLFEFERQLRQSNEKMSCINSSAIIYKFCAIAKVKIFARLSQK